MQLVERLCREAGTWALLDPLAITVAGRLVKRYSELMATLGSWVMDHDFWMRRATLLAPLPPIRRGNAGLARVLRYADALLDEREFFIRKAIGWVLREMGKIRPGLVAAWLIPRAHRASGVTVREAAKYLAATQRDEVLRVHRAARRLCRS
jgi:3-methyladenine DNA glycosylase AlkD